MWRAIVCLGLACVVDDAYGTFNPTFSPIFSPTISPTQLKDRAECEIKPPLTVAGLFVERECDLLHNTITDAIFDIGFGEDKYEITAKFLQSVRSLDPEYVCNCFKLVDERRREQLREVFDNSNCLIQYFPLFGIDRATCDVGKDWDWPGTCLCEHLDFPVLSTDSACNKAAADGCDSDGNCVDVIDNVVPTTTPNKAEVLSFFESTIFGTANNIEVISTLTRTLIRTKMTYKGVDCMLEHTVDAAKASRTSQRPIIVIGNMTLEGVPFVRGREIIQVVLPEDGRFTFCPLLEHDRVLGDFDGGVVAVNAKILNSVISAILQVVVSETVDLYACSRTSKIAIWAAATVASPTLFNTIYMDAPGTGVASVKLVGRCGQSWSSLSSLGRYASWFKPSAVTVDVESWTYDTGDLLGIIAPTQIQAAMSDADLWNNPAGQKHAFSYSNKVYGTNHNLTTTANNPTSAICGHFVTTQSPTLSPIAASLTPTISPTPLVTTSAALGYGGLGIYGVIAVPIAGFLVLILIGLCFVMNHHVKDFEDKNKEIVRRDSMRRDRDSIKSKSSVQGRSKEESFGFASVPLKANPLYKSTSDLSTSKKAENVNGDEVITGFG